MVQAFEFHVIGEIYDADRSLMNDPGFLQEAIVSAVVGSGLTLFDVYVHEQRSGLIGIGVIGESHVAVRTWPDVGIVTVEVSSCKDAESTWMVYRRLVEMFRGKSGNAMEIRSGIRVIQKALLQKAV